MKRVVQGFCAIFLAFAAIFAVSFFVPSVANASEVFTSESVTIKELTTSMSAISRSRSDLERVEQSGVNVTGDQVTYLVFNWSELKSLLFTFTVGKGSYQYTLSVDYVQAETILPSISSSDVSELTLYSGAGSPEKDQTVYFTFYIDSNASSSSGTNVGRGNDFGLYRFSISYTYTSADTGSDVTISEDFYVAVLPDDVNTLTFPSNLQLSYSVSSGNSLLSAYTFSISGSVFTYCNPAYLVWQVVGEDINLVQYCYNKTMQETEEFSQFSCIYNSYGTPTGTTFYFDSAGIEGTWTVSLNVTNSSGEILQAYSSTVSTVKEGTTSTWWVALVSVVGAFAVLSLVVFVIIYIRKKKEGVW